MEIGLVKIGQIEDLMRGYIDDEKKISAFEALYMWSKGISSTSIAGVLRNKYDSIEGYNLMRSDIDGLEITRPNQNVDPAKEEVGVVIRDVFHKHKQPLLDKITEKLAILRNPELELLLTMIRSSLFEKDKINTDELKLSYNALFGQGIKYRELKNILRQLEKKGIIYCERPSFGETETIIIPDYIYSIQYEIEKKLPTVTITEEKNES